MSQERIDRITQRLADLEVDLSTAHQAMKQAKAQKRAVVAEIEECRAALFLLKDSGLSDAGRKQVVKLMTQGIPSAEVVGKPGAR